MYRVDLDVPFEDKDKVKRLGARWDANWKVWYVPAGVDALNLKQWFPNISHGQVRSKFFYTLTTMTECWKCKKAARIHGICLPSDHEKYELMETAAGVAIGAWVPQRNATVLSYVEDVSNTVSTAIGKLTKHYKLAYSKQMGQWYWVNHCSHCGIKIGDHSLHGEPGNALFFSNITEGLSIILRQHNSLFIGRAICGWWTSLDHYLNALQEHAEVKSNT